MLYTQLGKSGLVVSRLAMGTMLFGEGDYFGLQYTFDQAKANELINRSFDAGINLFDTAAAYNNGVSEQMLGKALGQRRNEAVITTKIAFRTGNAAFNAGISFKNIIDTAERSLKNLGTDYIDILMLHNDDPITPIEETLKALEILQQQGKIRYSGFSNWQAWKAATALQMQREKGYSPFIASQMHYSLLNRELDAEFIPMAQHHGVGMMVWSPLSSGFLTGKYTRENPEPESARLNSFDLGLFDRNWGYDVVDAVKSIAEAHKTSLTAVSLAWLLTKPYASTILIGVSKLEQLQANFDSLTITLTADEIKVLDDLTAPAMRYPKTFTNLHDQVLKDAKVF